MYDCSCDYEPADFATKRIHKARKSYRCEECGSTIQPGEKYEYVFGVWEGCPDIFRTCEDCHDLRQFMLNNFECFCWAYGGLFENVDEFFFEAPRDEIPPGVWFGAMRHRVRAKQKRRAEFHSWTRAADSNPAKAVAPPSVLPTAIN